MGDKARTAIDTYTRMLRRHIVKEEEIPFRPADSLITADKAKGLAQRFQRMEERGGQALTKALRRWCKL